MYSFSRFILPHETALAAKVNLLDLALLNLVRLADGLTD